MLTLNNLITKLQTIASNHLQINHFGYGDIWEILEKNSTTPIDMPLMWVVIGNATTANSTMTYNFTVVIGDLVNKDESNELEVQSDTILICKDVISEIKALADDDEQDIFFDSNHDTQWTLTPFTERFDDELSGWSFEFAIVIPYTNSNCITPN